MQKDEILLIAEDIMKLAHDEILMQLRFLDGALFAFPYAFQEKMGAHTYSGVNLTLDPEKLLLQFKKEPGIGMHIYLHSLLHQIFLHFAAEEKIDADLWDLASDIAVENTILELGLSGCRISSEETLETRLKLLKKQAGGLSADKIYKYFRVYEPSEDGKKEWKELTHYDEHIYRNTKELLSLDGEEWKKITERIKADLKSFSKDATGADALEENIKVATREKINYDAFLRSFMSHGESVRLDLDAFDYIYYTYGLELYGNMPLIEPPEYKEDHRIRDFVIAIDTSASCRGKLVQAFLKKTYQIMQNEESFFTKINVHILQCDNEVRKDTKITSKEEFEFFMQNAKLTGFGSTDFRPVFSYVDELMEAGEFEDLKGVIYFTDGYGLFPSSMPLYDVAFVFLGEDAYAPKVPAWAMKVVLEEEMAEAMQEEMEKAEEK